MIPNMQLGRRWAHSSHWGDRSNETVPVDGVLEHLFFEKQLHDLIGRIIFVLSPIPAVDDQGLLSGLGKVEYAA